MRIYSGVYFASLQLQFACQLCTPKKESRITAATYIVNSSTAGEGRLRTAFPVVNMARYKAQWCWWNLQSSIVTDILVKLFI